jgi:glutaredoxin
MKRWWVVAVALLSIGGAAEAQYRWRDASGQVNYGDFPPGDARDLKAVGARAPVETADANLTLPFELRRAKALYPVVLYSSDACPPCENARVYLRQRGVPFSERVLEAPDDGAALKRLTGFEQVPVMTIGRDVLGGFSSNDWSRALDAAGYPAESRLPAGYTGEPPRSLVSRVSGPANRVAPNGEVR